MRYQSPSVSGGTDFSKLTPSIQKMANSSFDLNANATLQIFSVSGKGLLQNLKLSAASAMIGTEIVIDGTTYPLYVFSSGVLSPFLAGGTTVGSPSNCNIDIKGPILFNSTLVVQVRNPDTTNHTGYAVSAIMVCGLF